MNKIKLVPLLVLYGLPVFLGALFSWFVPVFPAGWIFCLGFGVAWGALWTWINHYISL